MLTRILCSVFCLEMLYTDDLIASDASKGDENLMERKSTPSIELEGASCSQDSGGIVNNMELIQTVENSKMPEGDGHPIPSELIDSIDIIAVKKDGSVVLSIISVGYLDASEYTMERIIDKINTYISFIHDGDFETEFGQASFEKTHIVLNCNTQPNLAVLDLIDSIKDQVKDKNASLSIDIN